MASSVLAIGPLHEPLDSATPMTRRYTFPTFTSRPSGFSFPKKFVAVVGPSTATFERSLMSEAVMNAPYCALMFLILE